MIGRCGGTRAHASSSSAPVRSVPCFLSFFLVFVSPAGAPARGGGVGSRVSTRPHVHDVFTVIDRLPRTTLHYSYDGLSE